MILPIVGSFFRPPALILVRSIPVRTPLQLRPEPENPHDSFAIGVHVRLKECQIQEKDMPAILKGIEKAGETIESFRAKEWIHLGYIPKESAQQIQTPTRWTQTVDGHFTVTAEGKPAIQFDLS
jgi:hypothetical protein